MPPDPPPPAAAPALLPATIRDTSGRVLTVRPYTPADRPLLERFYGRFTPKRAAQGLPPEGEARLNAWLDGVLPGGDHLVVEVAGELVGHAMLMPMREQGAREYAIFLDEGVRGQGIGTQVNVLSAQLTRTLPNHRLWRTVEPLNRAAVRSYQKAGFHFVPSTLFSPELEMELDLTAA